MSGSTVQRLRKNMSVSTNTLDDLCNLLDCALSEIAAHVPEKMTAEELRNKYHKQYGAAPNAMLHRFVMGSSKNAGIMRFLLPPAHLRMGFFPACFGLVCYWGNA